MAAGWRVAMVVLAFALLALLVTAGRLTPDAQGHGTHQQLGLPPCTFYVIFRRPCPACGMTTSWAWLMRGEVGKALAANVGGTLLACMSLIGAPWLLASAIGGRWFGGRPKEWVLAVIAGLVCLATAAQWVWRLWTY